MVPDETRQKTEKLPRLGDHDVVIGFDAARRVGGERALVPCPVFEPDGEGLERMGRRTSGERAHEPGVHAATTERPERHVAHHLRPDGAAEQPVELLGGLVERHPGAFVERRSPEGGDGEAPPLEHGRVSGGEAANAVEERIRPGDVAEDQVFLQALATHPSGDAGGENRLDLGGEIQRAVADAVKERLDAEMVARQEHGVRGARHESRGRTSRSAASRIRRPTIHRRGRALPCRSACGTGAPASPIRCAPRGNCKSLRCT